MKRWETFLPQEDDVHSLEPAQMDYDYSWEGAVRRLEEDGVRVLPLEGV